MMNKGVLLATHQTQYLPYCDKVLVLDHGNIVFYGTYLDFFKTVSYLIHFCLYVCLIVCIIYLSIYLI